ncbi:PRC-barrel domain-containing protein [Cereibacter azotoformans]|uniref:PRC-barrel domain protein n=2 Tax=Cereibacter TaxID=1653176 RepID=A0A2T5KDF7_9RHOB|nr:PRC-barrel domain-containing protein [Cereibacter azotoformans]AXQ93613.1 PRC-barrel domain containing protein [Cereibacter sphaeroides]MBO4168618.1 PRC-barrel domain-containing protein [Cereibacter azotoformans]PTR20392.1 PRC-barrel domain protein [Cereibacter azotoformans]UIJ31950.1 PRC-barrel domain-containing protein [Cereibacter azotoformans]ULB09782.1 PRC-barrel domain-containing protein [Cereibacter azotoformans]
MTHPATSSSSMVSSADVNGTAVYSPNGEHLGHIDHLMIDKESGVIAYAIMGFGGFLGMAEDHHPIPWKKLNYDPSLGGFVTDITREQLEGAPARDENWRDDRNWGAATYNYYGIPPYWM